VTVHRLEAAVTADRIAKIDVNVSYATLFSFSNSSACSSRQGREPRMCRRLAIHPQEIGRPKSAPRPCLQWTWLHP
jgi:hypothetical protein